MVKGTANLALLHWRVLPLGKFNGIITEPLTVDNSYNCVPVIQVALLSQRSRAMLRVCQ